MCSVDEGRKHVLSRIYKTNRGVKVEESDHNTIVTEFYCKISKNSNEKKVDVFDLKDKEGQAKFKACTSGTNLLSSIFDNENADIDILTNRLEKKINGSIADNFKKIRVTTKTNNETDWLYNRMRFLKGKEDNESKTKLEQLRKQ